MTRACRRASLHHGVVTVMNRSTMMLDVTHYAVRRPTDHKCRLISKNRHLEMASAVVGLLAFADAASDLCKSRELQKQPGIRLGEGMHGFWLNQNWTRVWRVGLCLGGLRRRMHLVAGPSNCRDTPSDVCCLLSTWPTTCCSDNGIQKVNQLCNIVLLLGARPPQ